MQSDRIAGGKWFDYMPGSRNSPPKLSIVTTVALRFTLEKKDALDKWAIALGFASPTLTYDTEFDDNIYVYANDAVFYEKLRSNVGLRKVILDMFKTGVKKISLTATRLTVQLPSSAQRFTWSRYSATNLPLSEEMLNLLVNGMYQLQALSESLPPTQENTPYSKGARIDKFFRIGIISLLVISALVPALAFGSGDHILIDKLLLAKLACMYGLPVYAILFFGLRAIVSDSPYGADIFKYLLWAAPALIMIWSFTALYSINIYQDDTLSTLYHEPIVNKYYTSDRHGTHYNVNVQNWHENEKPISLSVTNASYQRLQVGDYVNIWVHPGKLGAEWISLH